MSASSDRVGQRVGDYVLERPLGRGGMSRVYFARERHTGRAAAIKILEAGLPSNMAADRRLEQEARAITRIDHPNVVEVYGWGRTADGLPYIAMEYLEGQTLAHVVSMGRSVPPGRLLPIIHQMISALGRAHTLDIIHRDLKPDNVFLVERVGPDGRIERDTVKMLDFGIAKLLGAQPHSLVHTVQGLVLGTPEYLPPELALGQDVSPATDIYALGVILFEGLTGRLPFIGHGAGELAEQHCFSQPPLLRGINPTVPAALEAVVLRCLEKQPAARYQSAHALSLALSPFGAEVRAPTVVNQGLVFPGVARAGDDGQVERVLRDAVARWWPEPGSVPAPLTGTMACLDDLRERIDATGTELALVEDGLHEHERGLDEREAELHDAMHREAALVEELRALRRRDGELAEGLGALDYGRRVLDTLAAYGAGIPADALQSVLVAPDVDDLEAHVHSAAEADAIAGARRAVHAEYTDLTRRRARTSAERAGLEAELCLARAQLLAERERLEAQRLGLLADLDELERGLSRALSRLALDLAVAIGAD